MTPPVVIKDGPWVASGSSGFTITQIENCNINQNVRVQQTIAAGEISPSFIYFLTAEPTITATTTNLGVLIAGGLTPTLGINGGSLLSTLVVYGTQVLNLGSVAGSSSHFTTTVNEGLLVLKSIHAAQAQKATGQLECHAIWNGTNDPVVYATNASLPSDMLVTEQYTLGAVNVSGSQLLGVKDVTIDTGITEVKVQSDGNLFPSLIYTSKWAPKVTITVTNAEVLNTFTLYGTAGTSTASDVYLVGCTNMGARYAPDTSNHIKITIPASQSYIHPESARLQAETGEGMLVIEPILGYSSGYIQPMTFTAGTTIGS